MKWDLLAFIICKYKVVKNAEQIEFTSDMSGDFLRLFARPLSFQMQILLILCVQPLV